MSPDQIWKFLELRKAAAILNFRNLEFVSCDLYRRAILLHCAKFHCWVTAKNKFQYGGRLQSWTLKIFIFVIEFSQNAGESITRTLSTIQVLLLQLISMTSQILPLQM